jgi:hypothetical protein
VEFRVVLGLLYRELAAAGGRPREFWVFARPGDDERELLLVVVMRSASVATSKELGARELLRLEPCTACGSSSWELFKLSGNLISVLIDEALLPTGVLLLDIHTPSTSIPLSMALIPKGISSLVSCCASGSTGCASSISGV